MAELISAANTKPPQSATKAHILLVEDERQIARFIELELLHEGYRVTIATNGVEALVQARQQRPDLVVLDLMLPGIDGLEVCRRLRATGDSSSKGNLTSDVAEREIVQQVPIIMVTAKDTVPDRVMGLKSGADDYLAKPFSIEELLARIEALLRRANFEPANSSNEQIVQPHRLLHFADLVVNTATREVRRSGQLIELTTKEYELLVFLLRHPRQVLSREQIYAAVWSYDFEGESNVIEVYVRYLRNKLDKGGTRLIHTIRGAGYVLKEG